jgi:hypothetical protein
MTDSSCPQRQQWEWEWESQWNLSINIDSIRNILAPAECVQLNDKKPPRIVRKLINSGDRPVAYSTTSNRMRAKIVLTANDDPECRSFPNNL